MFRFEFFRIMPFIIGIAISGCGKEPKNAASKLEASPIPKLEKEPSPIPSEKKLVSLSLSFGENDQTKIWNRFLQDTLFLSQAKSGKILIFQKSGAVWFVDAETGATEFQNASTETVETSAAKYTLPDRSRWEISADKISRTSVPESNGKFSISSYSIPQDNPNKGTLKPVFLNEDFLMLAGAKNIVLLEDKSQAFEKIEIPYPRDDVSLHSKIIGAGISTDKKAFWIFAAKTFFYGNIGKDANGASTVTYNDPIELAFSGISGTETFIAGVLEADGKAKNKLLLISSSGFYWSGIQSSINLTWDKDVRAISEQYCVSCHGPQGAGGFSKADEEASFKGTKRLSIIERVTQKTMPPPTSPAGMAITEAQRRAILVWLQPELGKITPEDPGDGNGAIIPTPVIPTPGPSWESKVQPILVNRCQTCHGAMYSNFSSVFSNRADIALRINSANASVIMPKPGSAEATAMTTAERAEVSTFLNSFR